MECLFRGEAYAYIEKIRAFSYDNKVELLNFIKKIISNCGQDNDLSKWFKLEETRVSGSTRDSYGHRVSEYEDFKNCDVQLTNPKIKFPSAQEYKAYKSSPTFFACRRRVIDATKFSNDVAGIICEYEASYHKVIDATNYTYCGTRRGFLMG